MSDENIRLVIVEFSLDLLQEMITTGWRIGDDSIVECLDGIPEGAELRGASLNGSFSVDSLQLKFYHPSLGVVPEGECIPVKKAIMKKNARPTLPQG